MIGIKLMYISISLRRKNMEPTDSRDDLQRAIDGSRAHLKYQTDMLNKWWSKIGWLFVVLGALLCLTLIGIPVGLALILVGCGFIWFPRFLARHAANSVDAYERGANQRRTGDQDRQ